MAPPTVPRSPNTWLDDLRGIVQLAGDGVAGVTGIAQALHGAITGLALPVGRREERPAGGIAGFVYGTVRKTSSLVTGAAGAVLAAAASLRGDAAASTVEDPRRRTILSALNGVLGDHLERTGNPLAVQMELIAPAERGPRILLLVHGLCMDDAPWLRKGHDHGQALAASLGCTPVYARYNSGLHVARNGALLADQLEDLLREWPVPVEGIDVVAHSMGGLVTRSALHQASAEMAWPAKLRKIVFLGTPHHGAALERGGNWLHRTLGMSPYLAPFMRLGALRSEGITDLRHGNVLLPREGDDRYSPTDTREAVPLPSHVECYAVAGVLGEPGNKALLGDGLVSVASALGRHADATHDLHIADSHTRVAARTGHMDLLSSEIVCESIRQWLAPARRPQG